MIQSRNILTTTTNISGESITDINPGGSFQASIVGTGTVSATVTIQCSLNGTYWLTLGTITLSGTTSASDGFTTGGEWLFYRAVTSSVTGTVTGIYVEMSEST